MSAVTSKLRENTAVGDPNLVVLECFDADKSRYALIKRLLPACGNLPEQPTLYIALVNGFAIERSTDILRVRKALLAMAQATNERQQAERRKALIDGKRWAVRFEKQLTKPTHRIPKRWEKI